MIQSLQLTVVDSAATAQWLNPEHPLGVPVEQLALDVLARRQAADGGNHLRAATLRALAIQVVAVAAEHQLVLVALDEFAGVVLVARERIETGAGGQVAIHVWVIAQVTVGEAARGDPAFGIE